MLSLWRGQQSRDEAARGGGLAAVDAYTESGEAAEAARTTESGSARPGQQVLAVSQTSW
jgi:hypothetical protein